jgi:predicted HicB family RNase H-like nuclease
MKMSTPIGNEKIGQIAPFGLRMPKHVKDWVGEKAQEQERSMNWIIVRLLESQMEAENQPAKN